MAVVGRGQPGRVELGGLLAGLGAILLLVSLFLDWFEPGVSAWTVFEALDLLLAGTAVAALAFGARSFGFLTIGATAAVTAGAIALIVVVSQLINQPPAALEADPETGAWLGLAGAALMFLGAFMSRTGVSIALDRAPPGQTVTTAGSRPEATRGTPPRHPGTPEPAPTAPSAPGQPDPAPAAPSAPGQPGPAPAAPNAPGQPDQSAPLPPREPPR